jgi:hypothetical protein
MAKAERVGVAWFFKPFFGIGVNLCAKTSGHLLSTA